MRYHKIIIVIEQAGRPVKGIKWRNIAFNDPHRWMNTLKSVARLYPKVHHINVYDDQQCHVAQFRFINDEFIRCK